MEELVKPRTRLDLVGKAGRIIDQSHQSRSDEGISPLLAPGQCTRITPQIREMGTKFLSKRHCCMDPYLHAEVLLWCTVFIGQNTSKLGEPMSDQRVSLTPRALWLICRWEERRGGEECVRTVKSWMS